MAIVKPFKGLRPPLEIVKKVASLPYDVMNSKEAQEMANGNKESLLHITRAEIDLPETTDFNNEEVYTKAKENFIKFQEQGILIQDDLEHYYIYAQTMNHKTQYGIVGVAACEDYKNGVIKKHELTRPDKEEDRKVLTRTLEANIEPVFFTYRANNKIDEIVHKVVSNQNPEYDFFSEDGFGHHFWVVKNEEDNKSIEQIFRDEIPETYVADGHHRTAAAAGIGDEFKAKNPNHTGNESYNYFMAVHFPHNHLQIIDYNRVVKDLNGLSNVEFLEKIKAHFLIENISSSTIKPTEPHSFSMYLENQWYLLKAKEHIIKPEDPIEGLDVSILSNYILEPILNIVNLRTDKRIDFIGGIRGMQALKERVDSGNMRVAFGLYPVSMEQLMNVADTNNIMPPKVTWFEPKLRSGLIIHKFNTN